MNCTSSIGGCEAGLYTGPSINKHKHFSININLNKSIMLKNVFRRTLSLSIDLLQKCLFVNDNDQFVFDHILPPRHFIGPTKAGVGLW